MTNASTVVIVGGGPAGLTCALGLRSHGFDGRVLVIDAEPEHVIQPRLHEAQRPDVSPVRVPFASIATRIGFDFRQATLSLDDDHLAALDRSRWIEVDGARIDFDYLVVTAGARPAGRARPGGGDLSHLRRLALPKAAEPRWVIGGGASAVQFAAELAQTEAIRLVTADDRLVPDLPLAFHTAAMARLGASGCDVALGQWVDEAPWGALWLTGVRPEPALSCNEFGQVRIRRFGLDRVYAAGDCAHFDGSGLNDLSAQAAVAKGKRVADNIRRRLGGRWQLGYRYRSLGYVLALGPNDAVAWVGSEHRIVQGPAALTIHEAIGVQYAAMLRGIDLFVQSNV